MGSMETIQSVGEILAPLIMSTENVEKMRSFVEENAKLIFSDADSNATINLWPWVISGILFMLAIPVIISILSSLYVPFYSVYKAASSYDHGYGRSDYDEYDDGYGFDNKWDSEFRRRRRGPGKRPRKEADDDDYDYGSSSSSYNDWKNSDYYKSWDRQNRELEAGGEIGRNMVVGLAESVSNAVKMIN